MKRILQLLFVSFLTFFPARSIAQFHTIVKDNDTKATKEKTNNVPKKRLDEEDYFFNYQDSVAKKEKESFAKEVKENTDFFNSTIGHEISIERDVPLFVNARDSLVFGLIKERMSVCLPLDFISINSGYGFRRDPVSKCERFHDGIDLKCNMQHVYSMLPGKVIKVEYSNKGYGNHVILDYGHIQCLYGHLAAITVHQGDAVFAGSIVGISGNTGKSSGPHLHIKIMAGKKSLNPTPFIAYLNKYITGLQDKLAYVRFGTRPPRELSIASLFEALDKYRVAFPKIVVAQALLETGYFTSNVCVNYNNLFGLRRPSDGAYYHFNNWEESVKAYRDYVQYKYRGGDYFRFLDRIGYAEDPTYINKVRSITNSL
jgi:murein DD-endopeptidase MepM/ murein hydrolase activator NlpD